MSRNIKFAIFVTAAFFMPHSINQLNAQAAPKGTTQVLKGSVPPGGYEFKLTVSGSQYVTVEGQTNVADGTKLLVNIKRPWLPDGQERVARGVPACGDPCFPAAGSDGKLINVVVKNGRFIAGPYSFGGKPFAPNRYPLEIYIVPDLGTATPAEVKAAGERPIATAEITVTAPSAPTRSPPEARGRPTQAKEAQDKMVFYESRYMLFGFLLRAARVCQGDKSHIDIAFSLLDPEELKAFSKAFPQTTGTWGEHGANNFNNAVMQKGIPAACTYALQVLREADEIAKAD